MQGFTTTGQRIQLYSNPGYPQHKDRVYENYQRNERRAASRQMEEGARDSGSSMATDDGSMIGSILGAIFCFLLFLLIVFAVCYPFTMYRTNPYYTTYSNDKWWCYHCMETWCANKCWYSNGL
jgi:hypothetical protein